LLRICRIKREKMKNNQLFKLSKDLFFKQKNILINKWHFQIITVFFLIFIGCNIFIFYQHDPTSDSCLTRKTKHHHPQSSLTIIIINFIIYTAKRLLYFYQTIFQKKLNIYLQNLKTWQKQLTWSISLKILLHSLIDDNWECLRIS
jgi:hypothetical protein